MFIVLRPLFPRLFADFEEAECPFCSEVCHCSACKPENFKGSDVRALGRPVFVCHR